jgi:hypothetical protein
MTIREKLVKALNKIVIGVVIGLLILAIWENWPAARKWLTNRLGELLEWTTADIYVARYRFANWMIVCVGIGSILTAVLRKPMAVPPVADVRTVADPTPTEQELEILWFIASYDGNPVEVGTIISRFGLRRLQTNRMLNNLGNFIRPASGGGAIDEVLGTPFVRLTEVGADFCARHERLPGMRNARTY